MRLLALSIVVLSAALLGSASVIGGSIGTHNITFPIFAGVIAFGVGCGSLLLMHQELQADGRPIIPTPGRPPDDAEIR